MTQYVDIQYIRNALGITGTKESCKGCKYNDQIGFACNTYEAPSFAYVCEVLDDAPTVDALVITRCKDCKHRPRQIEKNGGNWFDLEFPDNRCPCQGDDGRYNWMPDDNWFCGNAERKE